MHLLTTCQQIKAQLSKIIQSGRFLSVLSGKLVDSLMEVGVSLAKYFLPPLSSMASAFVVDVAIQRRMGRQGVVRAEKQLLWSFQIKILMISELKNH